MSDTEKKIEALRDAGKPAPGAVLPCNNSKHWVAGRLRYADDKTDVPAAESIIHKSGAAVQNPGPLGAGQIASHGIEADQYEISFPDIHADEWSVE